MFRNLVVALAALLSTTSPAFACPTISGIPDYNCDGNLDISIMGDSIVYGTGDTVNNGHGGYVIRAAAKLPKVHFSNLGVPGAHTRNLLTLIDDAFKRKFKPTVKSAIEDSDIVILDIGRNDRWEFGFPSATYRNIKRAVSRIQSYITAARGFPPMVVTAVLLLPNRGAQAPWVKELNGLIRAGNRAVSPSDLRFDLVSKRLLSSDGLHPTSIGYREVANVLVSYLTKTLPPKMRKARPDTDGDEIPDIIEISKYQTDKDLPDTDGDGKSDGEEVFTLRTNPLVAD